MEKSLRVLGSGEEDGHSHSHSHPQVEQVSASNGQTSAVHVSPSANGLKSRKNNGQTAADAHTSAGEDHDDQDAPSGKQPSKLSAYLNLFGDFVHNMYVHLLFPARRTVSDLIPRPLYHRTDGLAYVSIAL